MSRARVVPLFVLLSLLWGLSFPAISVGLESLPPLLFAAARYDVAAVLLMGYSMLRLDDWHPGTRDDRLAIIAGGLFLVAGNGLLFVGQQTVPSGVAAILQALTPIVTALWAVFLLDERLSIPGMAGILVGFVGIGLVVQPDPGNLAGGDTLGRSLIVVQAVSISLGGVLLQRTSPSIERIPLIGWSMLLGALILHLGSLGAGEAPGREVLAAVPLGAILYLGIFSTAIAFFIYFTILAEYGAFEASLVGYAVPVVATVAGVVVLDETIGVLTLVGFGLIAAGFGLLKREALADAAAAFAVTRP